MKQQLLAVGEKAVFVLVQLARHVVELGVIAKPRHGLLAQRGHRRGEVVQLVRQHPILERLDAVLDLFELVQVAGDELLKKVVEKPADAAVGPALFPGDAAQQPLQRALVVHEHDARGRDEIAAGERLAVLALVRQHERARQTVRAHLGLAHARVARRGRVVQRPLQTGQRRLVRQLFGCQQHDGGLLRRGRVLLLRERLPDGIPIQMRSLP